MVLAEQIKEIEQRREALERCLDIDQKRIDLRNEEEKTQEPNFWDNPDKAREQLRKVAGRTCPAPTGKQIFTPPAVYPP